jgi:SAM-dependent methyltransferase
VARTVDLYESAYGNFASEAYRQVRLETYGEDFGQTSWVTTEESKEIPRLLELTPDSSVLEVGCGSGGYALHVAETTGCRLIGLDINASGGSQCEPACAGQGTFCAGGFPGVRRFAASSFRGRKF